MQLCKLVRVLQIFFGNTFGAQFVDCCYMDRILPTSFGNMCLKIWTMTTIYIKDDKMVLYHFKNF